MIIYNNSNKVHPAMLLMIMIIIKRKISKPRKIILKSYLVKLSSQSKKASPATHTEANAWGH
jgi:hypothetical protein